MTMASAQTLKQQSRGGLVGRPVDSRLRTILTPYAFSYLTFVNITKEQLLLKSNKLGLKASGGGTHL